MSFSQLPNEIVFRIIQYSVKHKRSFAWIFVDKRTNQICKDNDLIHLMKKQVLITTLRISNCGNRLDLVQQYPYGEIAEFQRYKSVNHTISLFSNKGRNSSSLEYFLAEQHKYQDGELSSLIIHGDYKHYNGGNKLTRPPFHMKIVKRDYIKVIRLYNNESEKQYYKYNDGTLIEYGTEYLNFKIFHGRESEIIHDSNYINFWNNGLIDLSYNNGRNDDKNENFLIVGGFVKTVNIKCSLGCICNHIRCLDHWLEGHRVPIKIDHNWGSRDRTAQIGKLPKLKEYKRWQRVEIV